MELEDLLTEAARLLAQFSAEVKAAGAASLTDDVPIIVPHRAR